MLLMSLFINVIFAHQYEKIPLGDSGVTFQYESTIVYKKAASSTILYLYQALDKNGTILSRWLLKYGAKDYNDSDEIQDYYCLYPGKYKSIFESYHPVLSLESMAKLYPHTYANFQLDAQSYHHESLNVKYGGFMFVPYFENTLTLAKLLQVAKQGAKLTESNAFLLQKNLKEAVSNIHPVLDACHDNSLSSKFFSYHGDLHDQNVLVDQDMNVYIIDFGMMNNFDDEQDSLLKEMMNAIQAQVINMHKISSH